MKKIMCILSVLVMMVSLISGCSNSGNNDGILKNPSSDESLNTESEMEENILVDKLCEELINTEYSIDDMVIYNLMGYFCDRSYSGYMMNYDMINETNPIECLRNYRDNKYAVFNIKEGGRLYAFFTPYNNSSHSVWVKEPLTCKAFEELKPGDTMADIAEIDPIIALNKDGCFYNVHCIRAFNVQENTDQRPLSFHLFEDCLIVIEYEPIKYGTIGHTPKNKLIIEKIGVYKDFVYEIDNQTAYSGKYDFSIFPQDMVTAT